MQQCLQPQTQAEQVLPEASVKFRTKRNASLETVLNENDFVLVDGSSKNIHEDYGKRTIFANHYSLINPEELEREIELNKKLAAVIGSKKARTIPEIVGELEIYARKIRNQLEFLNSHNTSKKFNSVVKWVLNHLLPEERPFNRRGEALSIRDRNSEMYGKLVSVVEKCVALSRSKLINIDDPGYEELVGVVKLIDRTIGLKKSSKMGVQEPDFGFSYHDADEKLVALAYWISMFSDRKAAILTRDRDFFYLIPITARLLGAKEFLPDNKKFREALHSNPVRLYYRTDEDSCEECDTSVLKYDSIFVLHNAGKGKSEKARYCVGQFLKHFADYDREVHLRFED